MHGAECKEAGEVEEDTATGGFLEQQREQEQQQQQPLSATHHSHSHSHWEEHILSLLRVVSFRRRDTVHAVRDWLKNKQPNAGEEESEHKDRHKDRDKAGRLRVGDRGAVPVPAVSTHTGAAAVREGRHGFLQAWLRQVRASRISNLLSPNLTLSLTATDCH